MPSRNDLSYFAETTLPKQDYIARVFGYGIAALAVTLGQFYQYFDSNTDIVIAIALLYPHLIYILSGPFRKKHAYSARQFLIHGDAIWCGLFLGYIQFPIELVVLFGIMINTSFIVVGSLTAWAFCVISLVSGAAAAYLLFGYRTPAALPSDVFLMTAAGIGFHLALGMRSLVVKIPAQRQDKWSPLWCSSQSSRIVSRRVPEG